MRSQTIKNQHLVIVLPSCGGRTIGQNAIIHAEYLAKTYDVTIVSDTFPEFFPDTVEKVSVVPPTFNILHRFCHVPNELAFSWSIRNKVIKLHSVKPISFILCHSYSLTHFVGSYMKRLYSVAYGMFMHGHIFTRPKGTYDSRITAYYRWLAPGCYKNADVIFSLSKSQKRCAVKAGAKEDNVKVTPNGLEIGSIGITHQQVRDAVEQRFSQQQVNLIFVGRRSPEKGFTVLLDACEILLKSDQKFHLQIVGGGETKDADMQRISFGVLSHYVTLTAAVRRSLLGNYYLAADILCVPSIDEAFGNVVLEGMISGGVVIGSDTGGIAEIIEDGKTGFLLEPGNAKELAAKIIECTSSNSRCFDISKRARDRVINYYNWENILNRMESDITGVISQSGNGQDR